MVEALQEDFLDCKCQSMHRANLLALLARLDLVIYTSRCRVQRDSKSSGKTDTKSGQTASEIR